ncbi:MAG: hypothetical protein M1833_002344 [Piccolia ochrophora]|nr:MAG: hypothetical protein M1833_002344 [Piccolia ochrophora]
MLKNTKFIVLVLQQDFLIDDQAKCAASEVWQRLEDASIDNDDDEMDRAIYDMIDLIKEMIEEAPAISALDAFSNPPTLMLQLVPLEGKQKIIRRNIAAPRYKTNSVDSAKINAELPLVPSRDVTVLRSLFAQRVLKEVLALQRISEAVEGSIKIPTLRAFVTSTDEEVIGILIDYIETSEEIHSLNAAAVATAESSRRGKWASQVDDMLHRLHAIDVVWGDVKTANVLIDKDDDAWIIDFGGGNTQGWIDRELCGTKKGDLQGLQKILDVLAGKEVIF